MPTTFVNQVPLFYEEYGAGEPLGRGVVRRSGSDVSVVVCAVVGDRDLDPRHLAGELVPSVVGGDGRAVVAANLQWLVAGEW